MGEQSFVDRVISKMFRIEQGPIDRHHDGRGWREIQISCPVCYSASWADELLAQSGNPFTCRCGYAAAIHNHLSEPKPDAVKASDRGKGTGRFPPERLELSPPPPPGISFKKNAFETVAPAVPWVPTPECSCSQCKAVELKSWHHITVARARELRSKHGIAIRVMLDGVDVSDRCVEAHDIEGWAVLTPGSGDIAKETRRGRVDFFDGNRCRARVEDGGYQVRADSERLPTRDPAREYDGMRCGRRSIWTLGFMYSDVHALARLEKAITAEFFGQPAWDLVLKALKAADVKVLQ